MCGICGSVGRADGTLIEQMTRTLVHRGPDGEGTKVFPTVSGSVPAALGHRRLSIIDTTERGAQPMPYAGDRYWITFNGEIYNYRELRGELEELGFSFKTETDTEVLLASFVAHGPGMLDRINGIFAFGIWDREESSLFLARDRLGVKPLYWARRDEELHFASEIKALLPALPPPSMRTEMLPDYLRLLWVPDPDTLFEGVYKLPPGHWARFENGELNIHKYWDLEFDIASHSETEWAEMVRSKVFEAVHRQMVSDVPLGSFLSGGIDSSAIVAAMSTEGEKVSTYTVGFSADDLAHEIVPDDVKFSRQVAEEFNTDYHEETLSPAIVDLLPKLIWHMDEPIADPACISTYLICSAAREKMTVMLSGMGGDEIFAGYPRHLAARIGHWSDILPKSVRKAIREFSEGRLTVGKPGRMRGPRRNLMKLLRGIDAEPLERYLTYCSYYRPEELEKLMPGLGEQGHPDSLDRHRSYADRVSGEHWLNRILYTDMKTFLPCLNLAYTDKMSMAASTEVRVPLLDDEMVELAASIPPSLKLRRTTRKYIFKRSMDGVLPSDVIWRPKAGFGAPVRSWLSGDLKPMVDDLLSPATVAARGHFDPDEVQRLIAANESGQEDNALRIWALLTLELWQRKFIDQEGSQFAA